MIWKFFRDMFSAPNAGFSERYEHCLQRGTEILQSAKLPSEFARLERRIHEEFSLFHRWSTDTQTTRLLDDEIMATKSVPGLSRVFMFHGDGRVRAAALDQLQGPLIAPGSVYALFWRLNDWVPEVREIAKRAIERCLPTTPAVVIVPALKVLLLHVPSWGRWSQDGPETINALLMRQDVVESLLQDIISTRQSKLGLIFREISRNPWVDQHLEKVLREAKLPHIRAMALEALISKRMRWPERKSRKVWIDQYMKKYRVEQVFSERELTSAVHLPTCLLLGAKDQASIVRKRAADGVIAFRNSDILSEQLDELVDLLDEDKNLGVQGRIEFLKRKLSEEGKSKSAR